MAFPNKHDFIEERQWTPICLGRPVTLAKIMDEGLLFHGVDASVSASDDYAPPRALALDLYNDFPSLEGLAYRSRHNNGEICYALFDRVLSTDLVELPSHLFEDNANAYRRTGSTAWRHLGHQRTDLAAISSCRSHLGAILRPYAFRPSTCRSHSYARSATWASQELPSTLFGVMSRSLPLKAVSNIDDVREGFSPCVELPIISLCLSICVVALTGCATPGDGSRPLATASTSGKPQKNAAEAAVAPPSNYQSLIVKYLRESRYGPKIHRATISEPYEEWLGLINGGFRPAVCVQVYRETLLLSEARDTWVFSFKDGQIDSAGFINVSSGCKDLTPIKELAKQS